MSFVCLAAVKKAFLKHGTYSNANFILTGNEMILTYDRYDRKLSLFVMGLHGPIYHI